MPFDFQAYDIKCNGLSAEELQREWQHYTRLITGAATSTTVSGLAIPLTLGVSTIGVAMAAPAIHNARKKREIIERHLQRHSARHITRKRDVFSGAAISGTIGVVTLGVGTAGADALAQQGAEHGISAIVANETAIKVVTHAALDGVGMGVEHAHTSHVKKREARKAFEKAGIFQAVTDAKVNEAGYGHNISGASTSRLSLVHPPPPYSPGQGLGVPAQQYTQYQQPQYEQAQYQHTQYQQPQYEQVQYQQTQYQPTALSVPVHYGVNEIHHATIDAKVDPFYQGQQQQGQPLQLPSVECSVYSVAQPAPMSTNSLDMKSMAMAVPIIETYNHTPEPTHSSRPATQEIPRKAISTSQALSPFPNTSTPIQTTQPASLGHQTIILKEESLDHLFADVERQFSTPLPAAGQHQPPRPPPKELEISHHTPMSFQALPVSSFYELEGSETPAKPQIHQPQPRSVIPPQQETSCDPVVAQTSTNQEQQSWTVQERQCISRQSTVSSIPPRVFDGTPSIVGTGPPTPITPQTYYQPSPSHSPLPHRPTPQATHPYSQPAIPTQPVMETYLPSPPTPQSYPQQQYSQPAYYCPPPPANGYPAPAPGPAVSKRRSIMAAITMKATSTLAQIPSSNTSSRYPPQPHHAAYTPTEPTQQYQQTQQGQHYQFQSAGAWPQPSQTQQTLHQQPQPPYNHHVNPQQHHPAHAPAEPSYGPVPVPKVYSTRPQSQVFPPTPISPPSAALAQPQQPYGSNVGYFPPAAY